VAEHHLFEEIARIVSEAKGGGGTLRTGYHAALLFDAYPTTFSLGRIIDELILAAAREGVPVEISRS
jgi:hypothetical protein